MKVIKVKVKTIILAIFIFFITIPYVFYFLGELSFPGKNTQSSYFNVYTVGLLKIYEKWPTIKINEGRTYYMMGRSNYDYMKEYLYNYANGMSSYSVKSGNMEQALVAKEYFEKGINLGEDDKYYVNNLNALINLEMALGNSKEAFAMIEAAKGSKVKVVYQMAIINEMVYYAKNGEYDKALQICENNKEEIPLIEDYKDMINYLKGDLNEIMPRDVFKYSEFDNEITQQEKIEIEKNKAITKANILDDIDFVSVIQNVNDGPFKLDENFAEISGRITVKGKPLANAKVFLNIENSGTFTNLRGLGIYLHESIYKQGQITYTNENGEYVFKHAYPDMKYEVIPAIPSAIGDNTARPQRSQRLILKPGEKFTVDVNLNEAINVTEVKTDYKSDEIVIKYDEVPGADSYGLLITSENMGSYVAQISKDDEIRIPLTNGSLQSFTIFTGDKVAHNGEMIISPQSYLGLVRENKVYITVIAYDKEGKILSQSFKPKKVNFRKKNLNYGENLIINGKVDEGYNWLEEKLDENPKNKEYMYPLMWLAYERGDKAFGDELINRLEEINKTGFDKAIGQWYKLYGE